MDGRGDVVDRHRLGGVVAGVAVGVGRLGRDGRAGGPVGEGAVEGAARVGVGGVALRPVGAAAGRDRTHGVLTRVGDRVAVGVGRTLVDRQVVTGARLTVGATLLTVTDWVAL